MKWETADIDRSNVMMVKKKKEKEKKKEACLTSYSSPVVKRQTFKALLFPELGCLPSFDSIISAFSNL